MAIDANNLGSIQAYQKLATLSNNSDTAGTKANQNSAISQFAQQTTEQTTLDATKTTIRNDMQASLVAHLFGDGTTADQSSLKLTYQAAIEKINEVLTANMDTTAEGETSSAPISEETLASQGGMDYWTPENTAKRIVDAATMFLGGFQKANPDLEGEELMNKFMDVVGGGLTQGFDEAKSILGDLDVLQGDIATNIDSTYQLVQDGMQNFKNQYLGLNQTDEAITETATEAADTEINNS
ncbi:DUF5610 domain-containing protein [Thiomicrorhabdus hydrogeniphila]